MPLRRFLRAYYTYVFLTDFILGYAIYTAYFSISGLGVWEIAIGLIADRIGILSAYGWGGAYLIVIALWAGWRDRRGQSAI